MVSVRRASTRACGPGLGLSIAAVRVGMGPDQSTPMTLPPARYFFTGGGPSQPVAEYRSSSPFTASAIWLASGLQTRASTCGRLELMRRGAAVEGDGVGE